MYNTEKYVGACLTSILSQTFQNFEVIVVDDCSTDNSCAIVENFIPKFGGRLKLYRSEVNHGPAIPSNRGISLSRGKYLFIMDSDDLILNRTLEILYKYAEKYQVDVVHMNFSLRFIKNSGNPFPANGDMYGVYWPVATPINKLTFESDDIAERMTKISKDAVGRAAWQKFVRRDFIIENEIIFPNIRTSQDVAWVIEVFLFAKKILEIPEMLYIYRANPTSNSTKKRNADDNVRFRMNAYYGGLEFLLNFFDKNKVFEENPQCRYQLLEYWAKLNSITGIIPKAPPHEIYKILRDSLKDKLGENSKSMAYFGYLSNLLRYRLISAEQRAEKLEKQLRELQVKL